MEQQQQVVSSQGSYKSSFPSLAYISLRHNFFWKQTMSTLYYLESIFGRKRVEENPGISSKATRRCEYVETNVDTASVHSGSLSGSDIGSSNHRHRRTRDRKIQSRGRGPNSNVSGNRQTLGDSDGTHENDLASSEESAKIASILKRRSPKFTPVSRQMKLVGRETSDSRRHKVRSGTLIGRNSLPSCSSSAMDVQQRTSLSSIDESVSFNKHRQDSGDESFTGEFEASLRKNLRATDRHNSREVLEQILKGKRHAEKHEIDNQLERDTGGMCASHPDASDSLCEVCKQVQTHRNISCRVCHLPHRQHDELILISPNLYRCLQEQKKKTKKQRRVVRSKRPTSDHKSLHRKRDMKSDSNLSFVSSRSGRTALLDDSVAAGVSYDRHRKRMDISENLKTQLYALMEKVKFNTGFTSSLNSVTALDKTQDSKHAGASDGDLREDGDSVERGETPEGSYITGNLAEDNNCGSELRTLGEFRRLQDRLVDERIQAFIAEGGFPSRHNITPTEELSMIPERDFQEEELDLPQHKPCVLDDEKLLTSLRENVAGKWSTCQNGGPTEEGSRELTHLIQEKPPTENQNVLELNLKEETEKGHNLIEASCIQSKEPEADEHVRLLEGDETVENPPGPSSETVDVGEIDHVEFPTLDETTPCSIVCDGADSTTMPEHGQTDKRTEDKESQVDEKLIKQEQVATAKPPVPSQSKVFHKKYSRLEAEREARRLTCASRSRLADTYCKKITSDSKKSFLCELSPSATYVKSAHRSLQEKRKKTCLVKGLDPPPQVRRADESQEKAEDQMGSSGQAAENEDQMSNQTTDGQGQEGDGLTVDSLLPEQTSATQAGFFKKLYRNLVRPTGKKLADDLKKYGKKNVPLRFKIPSRLGFVEIQDAKPVYLSELLKFMGMQRSRSWAPNSENDETSDNSEADRSGRQLGHRRGHRGQVQSDQSWSVPQYATLTDSLTRFKSRTVDRVVDYVTQGDLPHHILQRLPVVQDWVPSLQRPVLLASVDRPSARRTPRQQFPTIVESNMTLMDSSSGSREGDSYFSTSNTSNMTNISGSRASSAREPASSRVHHKKSFHKSGTDHNIQYRGADRIQGHTRRGVALSSPPKRATDRKAELSYENVTEKKRASRKKEPARTGRKSGHRDVRERDDGFTDESESLAQDSEESISFRTGRRDVDKLVDKTGKTGFFEQQTEGRRAFSAGKAFVDASFAIADGGLQRFPSVSRMKDAVADRVRQMVQGTPVESASRNLYRELMSLRARSLPAQFTRVPSLSEVGKLGNRTRTLVNRGLDSLKHQMANGQAEQGSPTKAPEPRWMYDENPALPRNVRQPTPLTYVRTLVPAMNLAGTSPHAAMTGVGQFISLEPTMANFEHQNSEPNEMGTDRHGSMLAGGASMSRETPPPSKVLHKKYSTESKDRERQILESLGRGPPFRKKSPSSQKKAEEPPIGSEPVASVNLKKPEDALVGDVPALPVSDIKTEKASFGSVPAAPVNEDKPEKVPVGNVAAMPLSEKRIDKALVGIFAALSSSEKEAEKAHVKGVAAASVSEKRAEATSVGSAQAAETISEKASAGSSPAKYPRSSVLAKQATRTEERQKKERLLMEEYARSLRGDMMDECPCFLEETDAGGQGVLDDHPGRREDGTVSLTATFGHLLQGTPLGYVSKKLLSKVDNFSDKNVPLKFQIPSSYQLYQAPDAQPMYISRETKDWIIELLRSPNKKAKVLDLIGRKLIESGGRQSHGKNTRDEEEREKTQMLRRETRARDVDERETTQMSRRETRARDQEERETYRESRRERNARDHEGRETHRESRRERSARDHEGRETYRESRRERSARDHEEREESRVLRRGRSREQDERGASLVPWTEESSLTQTEQGLPGREERRYSSLSRASHVVHSKHPYSSATLRTSPQQAWPSSPKKSTQDTDDWFSTSPTSLKQNDPRRQEATPQTHTLLKDEPFPASHTQGSQPSWLRHMRTEQIMKLTTLSGSATARHPLLQEQHGFHLDRPTVKMVDHQMTSLSGSDDMVGPPSADLLTSPRAADELTSAKTAAEVPEQSAFNLDETSRTGQEETSSGSLVSRLLEAFIKFGQRNVPLKYDVTRTSLKEMSPHARPMTLSRQDWDNFLSWLGLAEECEDTPPRSFLRSEDTDSQPHEDLPNLVPKEAQPQIYDNQEAESERYLEVPPPIGYVDCHRELTFGYPAVPLPVRHSVHHRRFRRQGRCGQPYRAVPQARSVPCQRQARSYNFAHTRRIKSRSDVYSQGELNRSTSFYTLGRYHLKNLNLKKLKLGHILKDCKASKAWKEQDAADIQEKNAEEEHCSNTTCGAMLDNCTRIRYHSKPFHAATFADRNTEADNESQLSSHPTTCRYLEKTAQMSHADNPNKYTLPENSVSKYCNDKILSDRAPNCDRSWGVQGDAVNQLRQIRAESNNCLLASKDRADDRTHGYHVQECKLNHLTYHDLPAYNHSLHGTRLRSSEWRDSKWTPGSSKAAPTLPRPELYPARATSAAAPNCIATWKDYSCNWRPGSATGSFQGPALVGLSNGSTRTNSHKLANDVYHNPYYSNFLSSSKFSNKTTHLPVSRRLLGYCLDNTGGFHQLGRVSNTPYRPNIFNAHSRLYGVRANMYATPYNNSLTTHTNHRTPYTNQLTTMNFPRDPTNLSF